MLPPEAAAAPSWTRPPAHFLCMGWEGHFRHTFLCRPLYFHSHFTLFQAELPPRPWLLLRGSRGPCPRFFSPVSPKLV